MRPLSLYNALAHYDDGWDLTAGGVVTFFGSFCTEIEGGRFDEVELAFCP